MKILVIGNGGREHAIVWKFLRDDPAAEVFCAPGNAGTAERATNVAVSASDVDGIVAWARENKPDFTVVGPEVPLCLGVVDALEAAGFPAFGPCKAAARLEGSKAFAKEVMAAAQVPTAGAEVVRDEAAARAAIARFGVPVVLKADGLAAGKGVMVCMDEKNVESALADLFGGKFGAAAGEVLVEEFLDGEEASVLAFVDGKTVVPLASAQDHKRLLDGDKGPNTGGMGAYSPAPVMTDDMMAVVKAQVLRPVVEEMARRGVPYKGVLYAGLMLTKSGPKVLEFNCRFGDPETQAILPRLASPLLPALRACRDGTLDSCPVEWDPRPAVCVVMVSGGYPESYPKGKPVEGLGEAAALPDSVVFHAGTAKKGGMVVTDGGRVFGVTALGADVKEAVAAAYRAVVKVKFDGAFYRSDIAHRALERLALAAGRTARPPRRAGRSDSVPRSATY
ncbi:MAG: phosphoribosylamine--glycine ligase, partial [Kiritimatiellae bacterium]|nr:phosphoribosylamine--glycine ligase [Kiritimatiellia bacterium]